MVVTELFDCFFFNKFVGFVSGVLVGFWWVFVN